MLRAMEQIRRMRGGAQSHLMRCSDGNYYVVKFQNNPQRRRILVNALLGTRLAGRMGLPTAPVSAGEPRCDPFVLRAGVEGRAVVGTTRKGRTGRLQLPEKRNARFCADAQRHARTRRGQIAGLHRRAHPPESQIQRVCRCHVHLSAENERHKFVQETLRDARVEAVPMAGDRRLRQLWSTDHESRVLLHRSLVTHS
jgi:hypothetical protein